MKNIEEMQNKIKILDKELSDIIEELNIVNLEIEAINLLKASFERKQQLIIKKYENKQAELSQLHDEFSDLMVSGSNKKIN